MSEQAKAEPPKPSPSVMAVAKKRRPFARLGESHLVISADAVVCRRCLAVTPRLAGAALVIVEHEPSCDVVQQRAA